MLLIALNICQLVLNNIFHCLITLVIYNFFRQKKPDLSLSQVPLYIKYSYFSKIGNLLRTSELTADS